MASLQFDGHPTRPPSGIVSPLRARSRTQSISSDRPSTVGHGLASPPLSVSPQAAFIAASAASQIVTNDHDTHADTWYDESGMIPAGETALVSYPALHLVNNFLDQLLFNFLQVSKATTLAALRPAVTEVLKPKLAKDAINNADEELHEYLGGGDEDDYVQPRGADPSRDWDLELVWKRTRLRCMVYSSLGDLEEEDEDLYMEQENLELGADEQISDVISPAVAIFLTSVLEYMGELTLTVAGQASYHRVRTNFEKELKEGSRTMSDIADRIVVEEGDMERVALDRTLGRLWRGWKKRIRTPAALDLGIRSFSRASISHLRQDSNTTEAYGSHQNPAAIEESANDDEDGETASDGARDKDQDRVPADIPLPMGQYDVDEIEVPGLAHHSDDEDEDEEDVDTRPQRPKSLLITTSLQIAPEAAQPGTSRRIRHERSVSLPVSPSSQFITPVSEDEGDDSSSTYSTRDSDSEIDEAEHAKSDQPTTSTDPTDDFSQAPSARSRNRLSTIVNNTAFGPMTKVKDTALISEDMDQATTYEKAEIMTSARVSVASSSAPSSDGGVKRSASVRSARIVDVPGPRSPHSSRSPSMDATERVRSISGTRGSGTSTPPIAEETRTARLSEAQSRGGSSVPRAEISTERRRPSPDAESQVPYVDSSDARFTYAPTATYSGVGSDNSLRTNGRHAPYSQPARVPPTSRQHTLPPSTKVSVLNTHYSNGFIDEPIPEVPTRAPGHSNRHAPGPNSQSKVSIERTRTKESDDGAHPLPLQSHAPPRPIHTSGSSSSSATGRLKAVRTSEEHVTSHAESVARNFEELIQSNQTITYTLTPENMRDMDSPRSIDSPKLARFSRSKADDSFTQDRSRSSSNATDFKSVQMSQRMMTGGSTIPAENSQRPTPIAIPGASPISISKSPGLKSSATMTSVATAGPKSPRVPASLARDARVPADSTADFAEFIKSTGPPGENRPPTLRSSNAAPTTTASPHKMSSDSHRTSTNSNRNRYQPRDATADGTSETRDLVDFLRQGPPSAVSNTQRAPRHSSSRHPSDLEYGYGVPTTAKAIDTTIPEVRHSQASTNATEYSGPSMQSSVNSNTALLKNKGPNLPKMLDEDDMMPKRKTRRVRDPYAIDFSDEEDEDLIMMGTPQPPPKKEESLAEFLSNYDPPPEPRAPPISQKMPKKKASAPSLMNRFTRSRENKEAKAAAIAAANSIKANQRNLESRSLNSRMGTAGSKGGHIPIQVNVPAGYNKSGPVEGNAGQHHITSASPASRPAPSRRMPMKKFEPRDATPTLGRSGTAELAAFLRDSEPPPSAMMPPMQAPPADEPSSFTRFVRRTRQAL